jgi:methionyl-tRNA formyltransferase
MKIVYFGTDVFLSCFLYFAEHHQILGLYTYHNDEDYFTEYSIVREAKRMGIPVHYEDMTKEETCRYFLEQGCQLFFVAEYNRILPVPEGLDSFRGINLHSSLLPVGRSYYPIEAAMERDIKRSGVTMHKISPSLDAGDILDSYPLEISEEMDSVDVYLGCGLGAESMARRMMEDFEASWNKARTQKTDKKYPYWKRPSEEKLTITHEITTVQALDCFRRYNQLTQVILENRAYYIRAMDTGTAFLKEDVILIKGDQILYRVTDGHLRLILHTERGIGDET